LYYTVEGKKWQSLLKGSERQSLSEEFLSRQSNVLEGKEWQSFLNGSERQSLLEKVQYM